MSQGYVLIAEPDVRLARTFALLAREAALDAVIARDGIEAKRTVEARGSPALLVTDLVLPKLDGFGLLEALRRTASPRDMPALVVSSSMQLRSTASSLREKLGIAEVTASGMVTASLRSAMRRALDSASARPVAAPSATAGQRVSGSAAAGSSATPPPGRTAEATSPRPSATVPTVPAARAPVAGVPTVPAPRTAVASMPRVPAPRTVHAPERLARIDALGLVDEGPPDAALQQLVDETARALDVPIALVSLVLEHKQWFKAHVGLSGELLRDRGTPLEQSFCRHVVEADTPSPLIVPDARRHPLFASNLLVTRGVVGSYAGAPLLTPDGTVLGTLCAIDSEPLALGTEQIEKLVGLARRVAGELALRAAPATIPPSGGEETGALGGAFEAVLSQLDEGIVLMSSDRKLLYVNRALAELLALTADELRGWSFSSFVHRLAALSDDGESLLQRLHVHAEGPFVLREQLELARPLRRVLRFSAKPIRTPAGVVQLGVFSDVTVEADLRDAGEPPIFFVSE